MTFGCCCALNSVARDEQRGVDLVLRQMLARRQPEDVEAARDLRAVDVAVVPVGRPVAAGDQVLRVERTAIEERDLDRLGRIGEVEHRDAALVPRLHHDVASRAPESSDPLCATQFSMLGLRRRQLVVAAELQLAIDDRRRWRWRPSSARSVARQRGRVPPPHSSVKSTFVPSLLKVAECQ